MIQPKIFLLMCVFIGFFVSESEAGSLLLVADASADQNKLTIPGKPLLEGQNIYHPAHLKENSPFCVYMVATLTDSDWTTVNYTFIPEKSGEINFQVRGPYLSPDELIKRDGEHAWILVKDIKVVGGEIKNGQLSEVKGGKPLFWTLFRKAYMPSVEESGENTGCMSLTYQDYAEQNIKVEKGVKVTITCMAKDTL